MLTKTAPDAREEADAFRLAGSSFFRLCIIARDHQLSAFRPVSRGGTALSVSRAAGDLAHEQSEANAAVGTQTGTS